MSKYFTKQKEGEISLSDYLYQNSKGYSGFKIVNLAVFAGQNRNYLYNKWNDLEKRKVIKPLVDQFIQERIEKIEKERSGNVDNK